MTTTARLTFDAELQARVTTFVTETLHAVPELEGLAVVPVWAQFDAQLPHGFLRGRHGPLTQPGEIMHMAQQLHRMLYDVMTLSVESLLLIDAEMHRLATELQSPPDTPEIVL